MPIIRIDMWEGRTLDQKRRLVAEVTAAVVDVLQCEPSSVRILIDEYPTSDWAVAGELVSDRDPPAV
jgi:4-oxalocrotonate tautomerase